MKARCRLGVTVNLPCNWCKNDWCAHDLKPCEYLEFIAEHKDKKEPCG